MFSRRCGQSWEWGGGYKVNMVTRGFCFASFEALFLIDRQDLMDIVLTDISHDLYCFFLTLQQALYLGYTDRLPKQGAKLHVFFCWECPVAFISVSEGFMIPQLTRPKKDKNECTKTLLWGNRVFTWQSEYVRKRKIGSLFYLYFLKVNMEAVKIHERQKLSHDLNCLFLVILLILNWRHSGILFFRLGFVRMGW